MALRTIALDALVIGTGCAGYNAADWLHDYGMRSIAMLSEGRSMGTSRNTGSDKQTYYKLSLCADAKDSIYELAENLFAGGSVHGDTALCEAAGSVKAFMKLNALGVPFPTNRFGEYVGYKTDHDPRMRATSAGPLTSRIMTEKLEQAVLSKGVALYDGMQAVRLIADGGAVHGILALDLARLQEEDHGLTVFLTPNVVLCTGGPAIAYEKSVYPPSQTGATGMALEAGAAACNLQEWQYGLASVKFRWNVSGTYQQVLPRYISVDEKRVEREFLPDYFASPQQALDSVFLKGYQWPFDSSKIEGSSLIDLIVHHETTALGRRVLMDFTRDPMGLENGFDGLGGEARGYLARSEALLPTPFARLAHMNPQAIALYRSHGIDLAREPLEVAVCAQHNNGGIAVDADWQSSIRGLYVAGEAAGTFGVARPGGSALNSTQVGAQRAAEHIAFMQEKRQADAEAARRAAQELICEMRQMLALGGNPMKIRRDAQARMTRCAAQIRDPDGMRETAEWLESLPKVGAGSAQELAQAFKTRDMLTVQAAMLSAMQLTAEVCRSRGSALVLGGEGKCPLTENLSSYAYRTGGAPMRDRIVRTTMENGAFRSAFEPVRPLPKTDDWFETTWQAYNKTHRIGGGET